MLIVDFVNFVERLGRHNDFLAWLRTLPPTSTAAEAWERCDHGGWLVRLLGALRRRGLITWQMLVLAACAAARTALVHVPEGETRPRIAIETAERWARGEATAEEVRNAAAAADAAYAAAYTAADAAYAAAYTAAAAAAAYAAADAAYAAADADDAAAYTAADAYAVDAADADDAQRRAQRRAEIAAAVRSVVSWFVVEAALREVQS